MRSAETPNPLAAQPEVCGITAENCRILRSEAHIEPDPLVFAHEKFVRDLRLTPGTEQRNVLNPDYKPGIDKPDKRFIKKDFPLPVTTCTRSILYIMNELSIGTPEERERIAPVLSQLEDWFNSNFTQGARPISDELVIDLVNATRAESSVDLLRGVYAFQEAAEDFHADGRYNDLLARIEIFARYALYIFRNPNSNLEGGD